MPSDLGKNFTSVWYRPIGYIFPLVINVLGGMPVLRELFPKVCMTTFNFQLILELITKLVFKDLPFLEMQVNLVTLKGRMVNMPNSGFLSSVFQCRKIHIVWSECKSCGPPENAGLLILDLCKIC